MGIRNIGIIELMIWTVNPIPIKSPIAQHTANIASVIGGMRNMPFLKRRKRSIIIKKPVRGAVIPIWTNISLPNVSSAMGKPAK